MTPDLHASYDTVDGVLSAAYRQYVGRCMRGCLTDSQDQRRFLMHLLDTQQRETVGNVAEVKRLMQSVWQRRDTEGGGQPVAWRDVMRESQRELLLLV